MASPRRFGEAIAARVARRQMLARVQWKLRKITGRRTGHARALDALSPWRCGCEAGLHRGHLRLGGSVCQGNPEVGDRP